MGCQTYWRALSRVLLGGEKKKKLLEINVGKGYNKFAVQKSFVNNWQINSRPAHSSQEQFANREGSCAV